MQTVAARSRRAAPPRGNSRQRERAPKTARSEARASPAPAAPASELPRYLQRTPAGQPLPQPLRTEMEQRFGEPLAGVRVHTDSGAAASAGAMGAHAYTHQRDVVFGAGAYDPHSQRGRGLLAHELTHVLQQRRHGAGMQPSVADGGARPVAAGGDAAEREAEANAQRVHKSLPLTATQMPMQSVQRHVLGDVADYVGDKASDAYDAVADAAGDVVEWAGDRLRDAALAVVRRLAPSLVPLIEDGPIAWLGSKLGGVFDSIAGALAALNPIRLVQRLSSTFTDLVKHAASIVTALSSGNCQRLLNALGALKCFVGETAGAAWKRLTDFVQPIGDFFANVYEGFVSPALGWLQKIGGRVWQGILDFGQTLWEWTEPIRNVAGRVWNWVKEQLFGSGEGGVGEEGGSGGIVDWICRKAGEAWEWVKERTRPVWEPVASLARSVAGLWPPPFLSRFGERMNALAQDLGAADDAVGDGDGVAARRETLAVVLPSVQRVLGTLRGAVLWAGAWITAKVGGLGGIVTRLMSALRGSTLFGWLAYLLWWLEDAAAQLVSWAQDGVRALFDKMVAAFDALSPFIAALAGVVSRLIGVLRNLMSLGQLVLTSVWQAIPCCIREPLKNFIINRILARIPVFGQFFTDPTLWPRVRDTAMRVLHQVFIDGDLAGAAWTFFRAVLRILGLPPELVVQILAKAAGAIGSILLNPIGFIVNLVRTLSAGFGRFFRRIAAHLLRGVSGWLFAQARDAGVEPPADVSLRSLVGFVLQVMRITVEHVFERLVSRLDERTVARLRSMAGMATGVWRFVAILVTQGPTALWEELQSQLGNLWDTVVGGVIDWVTEKVIQKAVDWLMALLDVTGIMSVINALVAVYNAIESFVQYLREMLEIASRMLDGVAGIARGAIDTATDYLEEALGRSVPVVIGFLANQFGLGRLGARVRELLRAAHELVDRALDWLIDRAIRLGQSLIDMARRGASAAGSAVRSALSWLRLRVGFRAANGESHALYFRGDNANAVLTIASEPRPFRAWLDSLPSTANAADVALARRLFQQIQDLQGASPPAPQPSGAAPATPAANDPNERIPALTNELGIVAARLMPTDGNPASSPPVYGGLRHGFGSTAAVPTMTPRFAPGSEPGGNTTGGLWDDLALRGPSASNPYYVRGHLVNHHLGGSGETWANLTPLTQRANNRGGASMLRTFETPVKEAVIDQRHTVRNFQVTAELGQPSRGGDLADIDREIAQGTATPPQPTVRPVDELRRIRRVVHAEQFIPASLSLRAQVLLADGSTRNLSAPVANTIDTDWRRYQLRRA